MSVVETFCQTKKGRTNLPEELSEIDKTIPLLGVFLLPRTNLKLYLNFGKGTNKLQYHQIKFEIIAFVLRKRGCNVGCRDVLPSEERQEVLGLYGCWGGENACKKS